MNGSSHEYLRYRCKTDKVPLLLSHVEKLSGGTKPHAVTVITSLLTKQPRGWTSHGLDRRRGKTPTMNLPKSDNELLIQLLILNNNS